MVKASVDNSLKKVGQEGKRRVRRVKREDIGLIKGSEAVWGLWERLGSLPADENTQLWGEWQGWKQSQLTASQGSTKLPCQGVSPSPERCLGSSGVYKCSRTDWLQGFPINCLETAPYRKELVSREPLSKCTRILLG